MKPTTPHGIAALLILTVTTAGCVESDDERVARMATEHARSQAAQSRQMAELQQEVAQGTSRLVEANAEARREAVAMHHELQTERAAIDRQRDVLEAERREIASRRRSDPILAAAITQVGLVLGCLLPLVLCWYLLRRPVEPSDDQAVLETLIEDLASDQSRLLPPPPSRPALSYRDGPSQPESPSLDESGPPSDE